MSKGPLVSIKWVENNERRIGPFVYEFWSSRVKGRHMASLHVAPFLFEVEDSAESRHVKFKLYKLNVVLNF